MTRPDPGRAVGVGAQARRRNWWLSHSASRDATGSLAWREAGSGRPLVMMACYPADGRLFDAQLVAAAAGRLPVRAIAVDLPGFGRSPLPTPPPERYSVEGLAADLEQFLAERQLHAPILMGVAIGGSIMIELAARLVPQPHALVLLANKPSGDAPDMAGAREATAQRVLADGSAAVAAGLARAALSPAAPAEIVRRVEAMIAEADPRAIAALVRAIATRPDPTPLLPLLSMPVLVIAGGDDPFSPVSAVRRLASLIHAARFEVIAGAGHMAPIERPEAVTGVVAAFLASIQDSPEPVGSG